MPPNWQGKGNLQARRALLGEVGALKEWPHGVKSLFIGCDSIRREHTRGPRHAGEGVGARTDGQVTPRSTLSSAAPHPMRWEPNAGLTRERALLGAGFSTCENRHFKKTRTGRRRGRRGASRARECVRRACVISLDRGRSWLVLQSNCYGFSKELCKVMKVNAKPRLWPATHEH